MFLSIYYIVKVLNKKKNRTSALETYYSWCKENVGVNRAVPDWSFIYHKLEETWKIRERNEHVTHTSCSNHVTRNLRAVKQFSSTLKAFSRKKIKYDTQCFIQFSDQSFKALFAYDCYDRCDRWTFFFSAIAAIVAIIWKPGLNWLWGVEVSEFLMKHWVECWMVCSFSNGNNSRRKSKLLKVLKVLWWLRSDMRSDFSLRSLLFPRH